MSLVFSSHVDTLSLDDLESGILWEHIGSLTRDSPVVLHIFASGVSFPAAHPCFDLLKALSLYTDTVACSDSSVWHVAMDREKMSLEKMGAFEEMDLLVGECTVGLKWVFAHKTDAEGATIKGKEKTGLVALGLNQC